MLPDGTKPLPEPVTYLGQVQWHSTEGSFTKDIQGSTTKIDQSKISFKSPRGIELNFKYVALLCSFLDFIDAVLKYVMSCAAIS